MNSILIAALLFAASSAGLGILAGRWVLRKDRSRWFFAAFVPLIALVWPVVVGLFVVVSGNRWSAQHPQDDAPAMLLASFITVMAPSMIILGDLLAVIGILIAYFIADGKK